MVYLSTVEASAALRRLGLKHREFPRTGVGYHLRIERRTVRARDGGRVSEAVGPVRGWLTGRDYEAQAALAPAIAAAGFDVRITTLRGKPCQVSIAWRGTPGRMTVDSVEEHERRQAEMLAHIESLHHR